MLVIGTFPETRARRRKRKEDLRRSALDGGRRTAAKGKRLWQEASEANRLHRRAPRRAKRAPLAGQSFAREFAVEAMRV